MQLGYCGAILWGLGEWPKLLGVLVACSWKTWVPPSSSSTKPDAEDADQTPALSLATAASLKQPRQTLGQHQTYLSHSPSSHLTGPSPPVTPRPLLQHAFTTQPELPVGSHLFELTPAGCHCDSLLVLLSANIPESTLARKTPHLSFSQQHFA